MKNQIPTRKQVIFFILIVISFVYTTKIVGYPAPNRHAVPDVDQVYPPALPEVDTVYPTSPVDWRDSTLLTIGDSPESQKVFSTILRHLMPKGANVFIENRYGETLLSWLSTNRIKRMLRKHNPDNVVILFDISEPLAKEPERLKKQIRNIVDAIHPLTCYWLGSMTLLSNPTQDEALSAWVSPCTYISPNVLDPTTITRNEKGFSKSDTEKWAEKMWHSWYQAFQ